MQIPTTCHSSDGLRILPANRHSEVMVSYKTVYEYYRDQSVLPTHGNFKSEDELAAHERHRRHLFLDKLQLPPRLFREADLLEFGPDSGENALAFASWGAHCSLVEPNGQAHPCIREYFDRYGLTSQLTALHKLSVEEYGAAVGTAKQFDFLVAEGFVYTIKPSSVWMDLFSSLLRPEGFLVFYFLETAGCFFELFLMAVHARMKRLTGLGPVETSQMVFQTKWDSIPHIRTLESWTMDVMENPFIRLPYFNDTEDICRGLNAAGLSLYSSWPAIKHNADVYWHKTRLKPEDTRSRQERFLEHSRLSFFFGKTLFSMEPVPRALLGDILATTDRLVDDFNDSDSLALQGMLKTLGTFLRPENLYGDVADQEAARQALASTIQLLQLLEAGDPATITDFCATDHAFIHTWGMPTHYMVFTKQAPST